jgi:hypothetical protein
MSDTVASDAVLRRRRAVRARRRHRASARGESRGEGAIDEALRCKEDGISKVILFNLCGHGHFDMQAYQDYFADRLVDQEYDESELAMALAGLLSVSQAV